MFDSISRKDRKNIKKVRKTAKRFFKTFPGAYSLTVMGTRPDMTPLILTYTPDMKEDSIAAMRLALGLALVPEVSRFIRDQPDLVRELRAEYEAFNAKSQSSDPAPRVGTYL